MENSSTVNDYTTNQKLNGTVTFVLRCFHPPEMEFRHDLRNENREYLRKGRIYEENMFTQLI
jgi:hypothetical protein